MGLALPHQLWTGADFLSSPLATLYWWSIWALAAASVLVFRIGMPLLRSTRHGLRVASVEPDGARGVTVRVAGRDLSSLGARAGQFFVWRFLDGPGRTRGHPFSLSAAPGRELTLTARVVVDGTRRLAGLAPGTRVIIEGPYGEMTGERRTGTKLLMIGAGAGVAPLISLLEAEEYAPRDAILLTRDSVAEDALRQSAIADLVSRRGVRYLPFVGPRSSGPSSWIAASHSAWAGPDLLRHLVPDPEAYDVFICGTAAWMKDLTARPRERRVPSAPYPLRVLHDLTRENTMKKILYAVLATVSGLVLLFSYRTSLDAGGAAGHRSGGDGIRGQLGDADFGLDSGTGASGATSGTGLVDGTYTGDSSQTRYGPVQVQITVSGGQISDVQAIHYPDSNGRDRQINGTAIPRLVSETLQSQSAQIQMVSGATYTSDGYLSSLQNAIDQAQS